MRIPGPDRVLDLMQGDEAGLPGRLRAFAQFVLLHMAARSSVRVLEGTASQRGWAIGFGLCFLLSLHPRSFRFALFGALAVGSWKFIDIFPRNSNHFFVEYLCLLFLALANWSREADLRSLVRALRWATVLVLFWSGANKVVYGTYFNGAFLASILGSAGFADVFGWLVPAAELETLLATPWPGPFEFTTWPALLASNLVYGTELLAAALLIVPATRIFGVVLAVGVIAGIEAGARELMFGLLMMNLLGLFFEGRWSRGLLIGSASVYALLVLGKLGLLPFEAFN